jgi:hypothetical protein
LNGRVAFALRLDCLSLSDQAARIADTKGDPLRELLDRLEPGGHANELVRACALAASHLAVILQGDIGLTQPLPDRIDQLEERIQVLQNTLEESIRTTNSLISTLLRLELGDES